VKEGLTIGFDVLLNDSDERNLVKQYMVWSSNATGLFKNPTLFGRLVLGK